MDFAVAGNISICTHSLASTPPLEGEASADPHRISNQSKTRNTEPWAAQPACLGLIGNHISTQPLQCSTAATALATSASNPSLTKYTL